MTLGVGARVKRHVPLLSLQKVQTVPSWLHKQTEPQNGKWGAGGGCRQRELEEAGLLWVGQGTCSTCNGKTTQDLQWRAHWRADMTEISRPDNLGSPSVQSVATILSSLPYTLAAVPRAPVHLHPLHSTSRCVLRVWTVSKLGWVLRIQQWDSWEVRWVSIGLPWWLSYKESICQCKRRGFNSWVGNDPLEEGMAPHSSILPGRTSRTEEPGGLQTMGSKRVGHDWATEYAWTGEYRVRETSEGGIPGLMGEGRRGGLEKERATYPENKSRSILGLPLWPSG